MLRETDPYCDSLAICGWRVPPRQSPGSPAADGPWSSGGSLFAASLYAREWAYLPSAWDWAAQSLTLCVPPLFDGAFGSLRAPTSAVSPPSTQEAADKNPKVEARLTVGVTDPEEDMTNRRRHPTPNRRPRSDYMEAPSRTCPEDAYA